MLKTLKLAAIKLTCLEIKVIYINGINTQYLISGGGRGGAQHLEGHKYREIQTWENGGQIHSRNTYHTNCINSTKACQWT